jgi:N-carbamoylputrescine amidase
MQSAPPTRSPSCKWRCPAIPRPTSTLACAKVREAASHGAKVVCLPELFRTPYFCQKEDRRCSRWPRPSLAPAPKRWAGRRDEARSWSSRPCSNAARPACTTTPPRSSARTAASWACTARCTSPTIRPTTRSSTSRPGISDFAFSHRVRQPWRAHLLGPVVSRGRPTGGPARGRRDLLPHGHRLAPRRKGRARRRPARRLANRSARTRHRQRRVRGRRQPRGTRNTRGPARPGILGLELLLRPAGRGPDRGFERSPEILYGTVDPARIEDVRRNWPFLRDRRIDAYAGIDRRFFDKD